MFAHIDADLLVYRCGFAAERNRWYVGYNKAAPDLQTLGWDTIVEFDYKREAMDYLDRKFPNLMTRRDGIDFELWSERFCEPVENALHNVKVTVENIVDKLQPEDFNLYLSGPTNYRNDIAETRIYKGNRDPSHQPTHKQAIINYMKKNYDHVVSDGEEADDVVGYSHYEMYKADPAGTVIVSTDKDLDMIPGLHYNFVKEEHYNVTEESAERSFWTQMLTGDTSDNIPGLKGVGIQTAKKWIDHLPIEDVPYEVWTRYVSKVGDKAQDYFTEMGQLLWIRREREEIWTPPAFEEQSYEADEVSLFD